MYDFSKFAGAMRAMFNTPPPLRPSPIKKSSLRDRAAEKQSKRAFVKDLIRAQRVFYPDTDGSPPHHWHRGARKQYEKLVAEGIEQPVSYEQPKSKLFHREQKRIFSNARR